jgi:hypothetical protein
MLCVLQHGPFAIVRSIAEEVGVSYETVPRQLTKSSGLPPRFLKRVPDFLTADLKRKRVELEKELLDILRFEELMGSHLIITRDESWFCVDYSSDHIWTWADDKVRKKSVIKFGLKK